MWSKGIELERRGQLLKKLLPQIPILSLARHTFPEYREHAVDKDVFELLKQKLHFNFDQIRSKECSLIV